MADGTVRVKGQADFGQLVSEMKKAEKETSRLAKQFGISESKARTLQRQQDKLRNDTSKLTSALGGLRKGAEATQGSVGSMTTRLISAGEAVAALGPAAGLTAASLASVAVIVLGSAGVVSAMVGLSKASIEARDRLDALREAGAQIDDTAAHLAPVVRQTETGFRDLGVASDRLTASLGEHAAPAMSALVTSTAALVNETANAIDTYFRWEKRLDEVAFSTIGAHIGLQGLTAEIQEFNKAIGKLTGLDALTKAEVRAAGAAAMSAARRAEVIATMDAARKTAKKAAEESKRQHRQEQQEARERKEKNDEWLADLKRDFKLWDIQARQREKAIGLLDKWGNTVEKAGDRLGVAMENFSAANLILDEQAVLLEVLLGRLTAINDIVQPLGDAFTGFTSAMQTQSGQQLQRVLDQIEELESGGDQSSPRLEALKNQEAALRKEMKRQFDAAKAIQIAQAIAAAYVASNLALANPPGPPATAGIALATLAAGLANVAQIAAAQPREFHTGGLIGKNGPAAPDEVDIRARVGERVVTRQDQAQGAQRIEVAFQVKHKTFDRMVSDVVRTPGSRASRAAKRGGRIGHRNRRRR